ncbi:unnamed protein product, partial [Prorocentrum cordatum]
MRFAHVLCSSHLAISDGRYLALAVSPTRSSFTRIRSGEVLHVQSALHGSSVFCTLRGQEAKVDWSTAGEEACCQRSSRCLRDRPAWPPQAHAAPSRVCPEEEV